ncbi:MAG: hypothetical protein EBQ80_01470 [Proteobacteria bacterium]|nr:hypothetical protein [Pseudomonadota bacterium]
MATPTNPFTTYLEFCQQASASLWQSPAAYWQTVASIQALRGQYLAQLAQQAPLNWQALAQCKSWPEYVAECTKQYGQLALQNTALHNATQAHRMALYGQWQTLLQRSTSPASTSKTATTTATQQPPYIPVPISKPQPTPQPIIQSQPQTPAPTPLIIPSNITMLIPTPPAASSTADKPTASNVTPITQPTPEPQQATGTTGLPLYHSTISPTANSVMRSSAGSTIAAAASARRSVVARRQSARRRPR